MKYAPNKIYLHPAINDKNRPAALWMEESAFKDEEIYIRKDALLEWANERYQSTISNVGCYTGHSVWQEVIDKLNNF